MDLTLVIVLADPCTDAEERGISVDVGGAGRIKILQGGGGVDAVEENKQGMIGGSHSRPTGHPFEGDQ